MPSSLLIDVQTVLITIALITPRALVCLVILPAFGLRTLMGVPRKAVAIAASLPAALPTFYFVQETPPDYILAGMLLIKEAVFGAVLGVVLSIPFWVAQSIGSILDAQRSPIQIQSNNASVDPDASAIGALLLQAITLVMIQAGLFVAMTRILIESYAVWPSFNLAPPFEPGQLEVLIKRFGQFFWHIIVYGGPVIIPLILIDFAFAVIGIFASNLQVSFASSPVKSLVGLFILLIYWPTFSHYVAGDFSQLLDFTASLLQTGRR